MLVADSRRICLDYGRDSRKHLAYEIWENVCLKSVSRDYACFLHHLLITSLYGISESSTYRPSDRRDYGMGYNAAVEG